MFRLTDWRLERSEKGIIGYGVCYNNPRHPKGVRIHTDPAERIEMEEEGDYLSLYSASGNCFQLKLSEVREGFLSKIRGILEEEGIFPDDVVWASLIRERKGEEKKRWLSKQGAPGSLYIWLKNGRFVERVYWKRPDSRVVPVSFRRQWEGDSLWVLGGEGEEAFTGCGRLSLWGAAARLWGWMDGVDRIFVENEGNELVFMDEEGDRLFRFGEITGMRGKGARQKEFPEELYKENEKQFRLAERLVDMPRVKKVLLRLVEEKKLSAFWMVTEALEVAAQVKTAVYESCVGEDEIPVGMRGMLERYCGALTILMVLKLQGEAEAQWNELCRARRPLILYRGRPVTKEQAVELVAGEEPLFGEGSDNMKWDDPRKCSGVLGALLWRRNRPLSSWIYMDGTIGGNFVSKVKYPDLDEFLPDYMHLAERYPFLDMVISYTNYDESCCFWCSNGNTPYEGYEETCGCRDCEPYLDKIEEYDPDRSDYKSGKEKAGFEELYFSNWGTDHVRSDVGDSVILTIWIHFGETKILMGEEAASKFRDYHEQYCDPAYEFMFGSGLYWDPSICICSKEFVEDCFAFKGKPRSLCDEYVEQGLLEPFFEDARVVTKEWVEEQYRRFIAREEGV
ncbi:MAG: hypothetical protein HFI29_07775 [Lachnospiraceae bacterium]|nr:hypothetical protein [Lachnospiraceae bacterium]